MVLHICLAGHGNTLLPNSRPAASTALPLPPLLPISLLSPPLSFPSFFPSSLLSFFPPRHFGALSARKNVPSGKDSHYCRQLPRPFARPRPRATPSSRSSPRRRSPLFLVRCPWNKSPLLLTVQRDRRSHSSRLRQRRSQ